MTTPSPPILPSSGVFTASSPASVQTNDGDTSFLACPPNVLVSIFFPPISGNHVEYEMEITAKLVAQPETVPVDHRLVIYTTVDGYPVGGQGPYTAYSIGRNYTVYRVPVVATANYVAAGLQVRLYYGPEYNPGLVLGQIRITHARLIVNYSDNIGQPGPGGQRNTTSATGQVVVGTLVANARTDTTTVSTPTSTVNTVATAVTNFNPTIDNRLPTVTPSSAVNTITTVTGQGNTQVVVGQNGIAAAAVTSATSYTSPVPVTGPGSASVVNLTSTGSGAVDGILAATAFFTNEGAANVGVFSATATLTAEGRAAVSDSRGTARVDGALTALARAEDPFLNADGTRLDATSTMTVTSVSNVIIAAGRADADTVIGTVAEIVNVIVFSAAITALSQVTATALAAVSTIALIDPIMMIVGESSGSGYRLGFDQIRATATCNGESELVCDATPFIFEREGEFVYLTGSMILSSFSIDAQMRTAELMGDSTMILTSELITEPPVFATAMLTNTSDVTVDNAEFFPADGPFAMIFAEATFTGDARALNIEYVSSYLQDEESRLVAMGETFFSPGDPFATVALRTTTRLLAPVFIVPPQTRTGLMVGTSALMLIDIAVGSAKHLRGRTFLNTNTEEEFPPDLRTRTRLLAVSEATNRTRTAAPVTALTTTLFTTTPNSPVFQIDASLVSLSKADVVGAYSPGMVEGQMKGGVNNNLTDITTALTTLSNLIGVGGLEDGKSRLQGRTGFVAYGEGFGLTTVPIVLPARTRLMAKPVVHPSEAIAADILSSSNLLAAFTYTPTADAQAAEAGGAALLTTAVGMVLASQPRTATINASADTTAVGAELVTNLFLNFRTPTSLTNSTLKAAGFSATVFGVYKPTGTNNSGASALIAVPTVTGGQQNAIALPRGTSDLAARGEAVLAANVYLEEWTGRGVGQLVAVGEVEGGGITLGFFTPRTDSGMLAAFVVTQTHDANTASAITTTTMTALVTQVVDAASEMATTLTTDCVGAGIIETALVQDGYLFARAGLTAAGTVDVMADFATVLPATSSLLAVGDTPVQMNLHEESSLLAFGSLLVTEVYLRSDPNPNLLPPDTRLLAAGAYEDVGRTRRLWATTAIFRAVGITGPAPADGRALLKTQTKVAMAVGTTTLRPKVFAKVDDTLKFPPTPRRSQ